MFVTRVYSGGVVRALVLQSKCYVASHLGHAGKGFESQYAFGIQHDVAHEGIVAPVNQTVCPALRGVCILIPEQVDVPYGEDAIPHFT